MVWNMSIIVKYRSDCLLIAVYAKVASRTLSTLDVCQILENGAPAHAWKTEDKHRGKTQTDRIYYKMHAVMKSDILKASC